MIHDDIDLRSAEHRGFWKGFFAGTTFMFVAHFVLFFGLYLHASGLIN